MIKAVIYDMDDLMINSEPLHHKSWEETLKKYHHSIEEYTEELRTKFIGRRIIDTAEALIKAFDLNVSPEVLCQEKYKVFLRLIKEKLEPMPGLLYSLNLVKENGYEIALGSSATREYINFVLEKFSIKEFFKVIVSGDMVKHGKPHPEIYLVTCKQLNYLPKDCLVLEDATSGIESAKRAGCICIAVKNPNTPPQDRSKADKILSSLNSLTLDLIKSCSL